MATQCGQCLNLYNQDKYLPRICNSCGHSLCQTCLSNICFKDNTYKCPYCKNSTKAIWTKNQSLLNLIQTSCNNNKCEPHNRKAISLCCSTNCIVSPVICDLAQCSKLHKQKGTNNLPISFFFQTPKTQNDCIVQQIIQNLLHQVRKVVDKILNEQNKKYLNKCLDKQHVQSFKHETQSIINQIKQSNFSGISSKRLAELKKQMMNFQQQKQAQIMSGYIQLIQDEKKNIINALITAIDDIQVNVFETIATDSKKYDIPEKKQTPQFMTLNNSIKQQIKYSIKTECEIKKTKKTSNQYYEDAIKLCFQPKAHLEYQLIRQVIGRDFNIRLLYSAAKDEITMFKQKIAGQNNLFTRIQLGDGKIIGSFFKQSYPVSFAQDLFVTDSCAFIYWLNEFRVFKAAKGSISQYDISPDYLFSCGSTYNWDGFWFRKNFSELNPQLPTTTKQIKSKQYVDLNIPIPDRNVIRFQCYQIQFK